MFSLFCAILISIGSKGEIRKSFRSEHGRSEMAEASAFISHAYLSGSFNVYDDRIDEALTDSMRQAYNDKFGYGTYRSRTGDTATTKNKREVKKVRKDIADVATEKLERIRAELMSLVSSAVKRDNSINWQASEKSIREKYEQPPKPEPPEMLEELREPKRSDTRFDVELGILDKLISSRRERKEQEMDSMFKRYHRSWKEEVEEVRSENEKRTQKYQQDLIDWQNEIESLRENCKAEIARLTNLKEEYSSGRQVAVEKVASSILTNSKYPIDLFDKDPNIFFNPDSKLLVVDHPIPGPEDMPRREAIKYVKTRDVFKVKDLSKRNFKKLYESIPYQIALRTLYELFDGDEAEIIDTIVFNGWVTSVNPATGHEQTVCTLSVQASRDEIMSLNLAQVDPKACFKSLKGVSASKLMDVAPVNPIVNVDQEDSRFTDSRVIGDNLDGGENIAAMDWEDFEHLVRELFEKEFSKGGGEVKVTQSSRDGGIDAVAFDPDPVRGGKIVIQAKRYTRTVGVSAVRDLFGTVMNEGANKGILVTTSDYGPDAYKFAKDKPVQLLNGGNLLSLLEQHGYDARIDVEEARSRIG